MADDSNIRQTLLLRDPKKLTGHEPANAQVVIGNVLAHAPEDDTDGGWPHRLIRDEIERSPGAGLAQGLRTERLVAPKGTSSRSPVRA